MKKTLLTIILLCAILIGIDAQKWDGFFKPVTVDRITAVDKAGVGTWFFRPTASIAATVFTLGYNEDGTFDGINASFISKTGVGISYAHFVEADGEAVNNYSINGMLMLPTGGATNAAFAITASAFRVNAGIGYNAVKGAFKENIFFLTGVNFTF
jgi:hypothetical protein